MLKKNTILKGLIALITIFLLGYSGIIIIHSYFGGVFEKLDSQVKNEYARYKIGEFILKEVNTIQIEYYRSLSEDDKNKVLLDDDIDDEITHMKEALKVLANGGKLNNHIHLDVEPEILSLEEIHFKAEISKQTFKVEEISKQIESLEEIMESKESVSKEEILNLFADIKKSANKLLYDSKVNLEKLENNMKEQISFNKRLEFILSYFCMAFTLIVGYLVIKQILNKAKELEELTKKAKKSEEEAIKANDIKSQFLANMSHEIRTPLNAIIGFSDILAKAQMKKEDKDKAEVISKSANALLSIINDILDISKIESGKFEIEKKEFNLKIMLEQVVKLYSLSAHEKNIEFLYSADAQIPLSIKSDEIRIKQVLSNIINNAIKFTPKDKKIHFDVTLLEQDNSYATIQFLVKDEGIGIKEKEYEKVFEPFVQVDSSISRKYGGTGLGLAICQNIVNLLGSKIQLENHKDEGCTFFFNLKVKKGKNTEVFSNYDEEIKKEIEKPVLKENNLYKGKVLVAEDNSNNQLLIKVILEELGLEVKIVENGLLAVESYRNESFDIVFLDINMPIMNGVTALKEIREYEKEQKQYTPIIALTANAIKGDEELYINEGMDYYIPKPIETTKLKEILNIYLTKKQTNISNDENKKVEVEIKERLNATVISEKLGVSEKIASMVINKFKSDIFKELKEFEEIIESNDKEKIKQKAHYIKNSCLNVCLNEVCSTLFELEKASELSEKNIKNLYNFVKTQIETIIHS